MKIITLFFLVILLWECKPKSTTMSSKTITDTIAFNSIIEEWWKRPITNLFEPITRNYYAGRYKGENVNSIVEDSIQTPKYYKYANHADSIWIKKLNNLKLPEYMKESNLPNVYFKYDQIVNGYEVTARWKPFDENSETGYLIMNFQNKKTGKNFQYISEKYCNSYTSELVHSQGFKGFQEGDIFHFDYIPLESNTWYKGSQLGYDTPFQFLDVDFDGTKELLVNDYAYYQTGNLYMVYHITPNGLVEANYVPLNQIYNTTTIDTVNQRIITFDKDGCWSHLFCFFSKQKQEVKPTKYPKLQDKEHSLLIEYYNQKNNTFSLDSIYEYIRDTTSNYVMYVYYLKDKHDCKLKDSAHLGEVISISRGDFNKKHWRPIRWEYNIITPTLSFN